MILFFLYLAGLFGFILALGVLDETVQWALACIAYSTAPIH